MRGSRIVWEDILRETLAPFRVYYRAWWPRGNTPSIGQAFKLHAPRKQLAWSGYSRDGSDLPHPQLQSALTFTASGAPDVYKQKIVSCTRAHMTVVATCAFSLCYLLFCVILCYIRYCVSS